MLALRESMQSSCKHLSKSPAFCLVVAGSGVHAYVVDTGIRRTHSEFQSLDGSTVRASIDFTVANGTDIGDCNGHGTHVAGILGGAHLP